MAINSSKTFNQLAERYDSWFDRHRAVFQSEIKALAKVIPQSGEGLEIGVGSGRFAQSLGIKTGIDPSESLLLMARARGIHADKATAESLPFPDEQFDFVLISTVLCFLEEPIKALCEAKRVLKVDGILIIAELDKNTKLVQGYADEKDNPFYKEAHFYSVDEILNLLHSSGFIEREIYQTIFSPLEEIKTIELAKPGHGEGSYVIISAEVKKDRGQ